MKKRKIPHECLERLSPPFARLVFSAVECFLKDWDSIMLNVVFRLVEVRNLDELALPYVMHVVVYFQLEAVILDCDVFDPYFLLLIGNCLLLLLSFTFRFVKSLFSRILPFFSISLSFPHSFDCVSLMMASSVCVPVRLASSPEYPGFTVCCWESAD